MKKFLIILALFLTGCKYPDNKNPRQYKFNDIYRYENDEVICYMTSTYYASGISCVWKQMLKNSENVANNVSKPNSQHSEPNCNIMLKNPENFNTSDGNVKGDDR